MKQIGAERSEIFSLSAEEVAQLTQAIAFDLIPASISVRPEGHTRALVRFRTLNDAMTAKLAVV